ncbi:hypothetical protein PF002_g25472 [Phytophthora fragariae]|uniref:Secreted protein n=1 Tax=Phytophthora fragariae TaxID=53985 RepID=A0A6A3WMY9_9STRA|nr:hypothetical protein PF002_g25472 [Phytophthora fragariae]
MNSATLLVVVACLNAVAAAHTAVCRVLCPPISTMMLPLPPGPGLPLEPPSKKATLVTMSECGSNPISGPLCHRRIICSATCNFGFDSLVSGYVPHLHRSKASLTIALYFCRRSCERSGFCPSGCTLSTFIRHIAVTVTAHPIAHISSATVCSVSQGSSVCSLPHSTSHRGTSSILNPNMFLISLVATAPTPLLATPVHCSTRHRQCACVSGHSQTK